MQDLHSGVTVSQTHSGARSATHTTGNALEQLVWRFSVRRRPGKIKDKKSEAEREHLLALLINLRSIYDGTEPSESTRSSWRDSLAKTNDMV